MRAILIALLPLIAHADPATDRLWRAKCGSCHGADGKGQTDQGKKMAIADMSTGAWQGAISDEKIKAAISDGVKRDKGGIKQEMDGYQAKLKPEQMAALAAYVRTLKK